MKSKLALLLALMLLVSVFFGCQATQQPDPTQAGNQPSTGDNTQTPTPDSSNTGDNTDRVAKDTITIGGVELNDAEKSVTVDGEPVQLTPIEYNILHLLMRNPNRVFSSTQIYELVWNENAYGSESAVAVHIRHLREKIEINPSEPRYIKVVWGQGYKMEGKK